MQAELEIKTTPVKKRKKLSGKRNLAGYLFISPFLVGFFGLTLFPMVMSLYMSFTKFDLLGTPKWIGLHNYEKLFTHDPNYLASLRVTFTYVLTAVPFRLVFALGVALILSKIVKFSGLYRTGMYLPSIIGGSVAVAVMWQQLFGDNGAINSILSALHLHTVSWLGDPRIALWVVTMLYAWQFGSSMLIFLAGLKNIPNTYYEAAAVDGANAWTKFYKITLPLLTPVILFNVIMQIIDGFKAFTPAFIISNGSGGPMNSTLLYILYLYQQGFVYFQMGYASAMAWVLLVIISVLTAVIFRSSSHWVYYESGGDR